MIFISSHRQPYCRHTALERLVLESLALERLALERPALERLPYGTRKTGGDACACMQRDLYKANETY